MNSPLVWIVAGTLLPAAAILPGEPGFGSRYPSAKHGGHYLYNYYVPPAPSSTPWAPCWSPEGKWIAVSMQGSIWKVDPADGRAEELIHGATYHSSPDWSPDGRWIIYTADDGGKAIRLEVLEVATGETRALTQDEFLYLDPVFSPDGARVAYVSTKPNGYFNVWIRPIAGGRWAGPEIAVTRDHDFGRDRLYFGRWDMHLTPAWLPGGGELLILSNRDVPLGSGNVLRVQAAEGGIDRARTVLAEQTLYRTRPHVSADGKRFVYSGTRGAGDQFSNLYLQPTAGGEPYKLTFFSHDAFHPRWSPDGEWIAYVSNEGGLPQLALLETHGGANRTVRIAERRWRRPMGTLSARVLASDTGGPTPARVHLRASDGKLYTPEDAFARVSFAGDPFFHTAGVFELQVPAGKVSLEAVKGFEFWPERLEAEIRPNEVTQATIVLRRMTDLSARGWHSGSTHVHLNYGGNLRNTLENLLLMSEAEDQDVVNELVANKDNRVLDHQLFVKGGGPHPLSHRDRLLVVGQEYRPPFYGHVSFLGLKDHLLSPAATGYEGTAIESLYPSNTDMLRKARAQGATLGYVHAFKGEGDPQAEDLGQAKGYVVDAALGATDTIEWSEPNRAGFFPWYATLNCGLRVAATGGEDSITSLHYSKAVGSFRTYVHTGAKGLDMGAWLQGLRDGRSFVTNGPLLELTVNGSMPGEEVRLPAGGGAVEIEARVRSIVPLGKVLLVWSGGIVEELPLDADRRSLSIKRSLKAARSGWYHLRADGNPGEAHPLDASYTQAFTNPVWVLVGDQPVRSKAAAEYCLRWIDALQALAAAWPGWRSQKERDHVFAQFEEARAVYRRRAAEG